MKRFRRITALALTLVVIAMLGISASAATEFRAPLNGDFGVGAVVTGNITSNSVTATARLYEAGPENNIEIVEQELRATYTFSPDDGRTTYPGNETAISEDATVDLNFGPPADCEILSATYNYDAYYIANGVVDCYIQYGPVELTTQ